MEQRDTRNEIIRIGTGLIYRHGYNATGIEAILKEAGVPKGSFYHYFRSKEDFGLAVLDRFIEGFERRLITFLMDEEVTPLNRIRNFLESALARVSQNGCSRGCLIGNLGQEMADHNERFRERLNRIFDIWRLHIAECLRKAQQTGELDGDLDADAVAGFLLSGWEGAILQAKVLKSPKPMLDFVGMIFSTTLRRR